MTLKTEVNVKVVGNHIIGSIVNGTYRTDQLIIDRKIKSFTSNSIRSIIKELQELADLMDGVEVIDKLEDSDFGFIK